MKIRTKLTLQFLLIGVIIMTIASLAIYISSADFREEDFYSRLEKKASITAKLLIEVDAIDAETLREIERDNPINLPKEKIIIFNFKDSILYSSDEQQTLYIPKSFLKKIKTERNIRFKQGEYEVIGLLYAEQTEHFVVIAAATDILGLIILSNLRIILTVVFLISLILFFFAGWFYSGRALRPISSVIKQVDSISFSSLNLRVDEGNGTDEIAQLAKTFNKVLDRLEVAFKSQKDFISNASHELRTPLTSINGQLEVLLMKDRTSIDYKKVVESVLEDIKNIIDLSNRLLLLAQTSSETAQRKHLSVRLDDIILQAANELKRYNPTYNIHISIDESLLTPEQLVITGDEYLLKTAVSNIIENACKYSNDQSVNINLSCIGSWINISFTDKGVGISEDDIKIIFEPFCRGANVKSLSGHGIGLSLVHRIIKNHNGIIKVYSKLNEGTQVQLQLPSS